MNVVFMTMGLVVGLGVPSTPAGAAVASPVQAVPGTDRLWSVACPTTSTCVAVGRGYGGVVVTITNGVPGAPQPITQTNQLFGGSLNSVACPTPTTCIAVGTFGTGFALHPGAAGVVVVVTNGIPGSPQRVLSNGGLVSLAGVACQSATTCVAVGQEQFPGLAVGAVVPINNGVPGQVQDVGPPEVRSPPASNYLLAVDCSSTSTCRAVGTWDAPLPQPPGGPEGTTVTITDGVAAGPVRRVPGTSELSGISCPTAVTCVAVDLTGKVVTLTSGVPGPVQQLPAVKLYGVDCPTAHLCGAVGSAGTGVEVNVYDGSPGPVQPIPGTGDLYGLSCTTATSCEAVGDSPEIIGLGSGSVNGVTVSLSLLGPHMTLSKSASPTGGAGPLAVTYTYRLTNDGTDTLFHTIVTDDSCSPVVYRYGDGNGDQLLQPGETWVFSCSTTLSGAGPHTNTATGSGFNTATGLAVTSNTATATVTLT